MSLAIQFLSHCVRGQDGSRDFRSAEGPDKLVLASMSAWNLEMSNTHWDMQYVIRHFQSRSLGVFLISVLMVRPQVLFVICGGRKSTTINMASRGHTWGQFHCRHL